MFHCALFWNENGWYKGEEKTRFDIFFSSSSFISYDTIHCIHLFFEIVGLEMKCASFISLFCVAFIKEFDTTVGEYNVINLNEL